MPTPTPKSEGRTTISVWAPYLSTLEIDTLRANADQIGEVNFFWYQLGADGQIDGGVQSQTALAAARAAGMRVAPSIVNAGFSRENVIAAIGAPEARRKHIAAIVALVRENGYDGIDIDYEGLRPEDRATFSVFVEELATALHADSKWLSIAVHAKTDDAGTWNGPAAQDWVQLGAAVDAFKIMTYDYHYGTSSAGPIAPLDWVDEVLAYAATVVPPAKTYAGLHFYGYDWIGSVGQPLEWRQVARIVERENAEIVRDEPTEPWFTYDDGRQAVYFADAASIEARASAILARHPDLAGLAIWRLGGEDPENWPALHRALSAVD